MNNLMAVYIGMGSWSDSDYFEWQLLGDLKNGHYHGRVQERDKYVHHLAII